MVASAPPFPARPFHPSLALAAYAEGLIVGGRVAVFGDATLDLAEELWRRGARLVHVYDWNAIRVAEAAAGNKNRSLFFAPLNEVGDVGVRDGAFDFALIPDLSWAKDPQALLALTHRVVSTSGASLVASPNAEAKDRLVKVEHGTTPLGYYDLYELVALHFRVVRMIGQAPFIGYTVAEFSEDEPEPTIDTSLVQIEGREPDWFVALASERAVRIDPFCLVEIPIRPQGTALSTDTAAGEAEDQADIAITAGPSPLEQERDAARMALRDQEQVLAHERKRIEQVNAELAAAREQAALLTKRADNLGRALQLEEQERATLEVALEQARHDPEREQLRQRLQMLEHASAQAAQQHETEVAGLERLLSERASQFLELQGELVRREQLVRELVATLEEHASEGALGGHTDGDAMEQRFERLAAEAARREADLVAASWKIAQLERNLSRSSEDQR